MGLDIWFKEDIANILRAADEANLSAMAASENASLDAAGDGLAMELRRAYRRGFVAALATLALALGLSPAAVGTGFESETPKMEAGSGGRPLALPPSMRGGRRWEK